MKAEISNCEEYVLNRLLKLEEKCDAQRKQLDAFDEVVKAQFNALKTIASLCEIRSVGDSHYIDFQTVWQNRGNGAYDMLVKALGLDSQKMEENDNEKN